MDTSCCRCSSKSSTHSQSELESPPSSSPPTELGLGHQKSGGEDEGVVTLPGKLPPDDDDDDPWITVQQQQQLIVVTNPTIIQRRVFQERCRGAFLVLWPILLLTVLVACVSNS